MDLVRELSHKDALTQSYGKYKQYDNAQKS